MIGLSGRRKKGNQLVGNLETLADFDVDLYYADYARAIIEAGGLPVHIPLDVDPAAIASRLDGLVLSGGADIGPDRYGAAAETDAFTPEPERDAFELALLDLAVERSTPTLGICRGLQMINIHAGGTLHQDVPAHAGFAEPPETEWHGVSIEPESALGAIYGSTRSVNSLHHQTVDRLGADLRVTARSDDDTVEGLEHTSLPIVAVQWHPEMMTSRSDDPIFRWIVERAAENVVSHGQGVASPSEPH